jgi:hypothetical protein
MLVPLDFLFVFCEYEDPLQRMTVAATEKQKDCYDYSVCQLPVIVNCSLKSKCVIFPYRFQTILLQGILYGPAQGISQKD